MRVASHLGMSPGQYTRSHTHIEHLVWVEYLDEQMNNPGTVEHYLMSIQADLRQFMMMMAKGSAQPVDPDKLRIKFSRGGQGKTLDLEQIEREVEMNKAAWMSVANAGPPGQKPKIRKKYVTDEIVAENPFFRFPNGPA